MPRISLISRVMRRLGLIRAVDYTIGRDLFSDLKYILPGYEFKVAFDVGANKGQSLVQLKGAYRNCLVHSFEPVRSSFEILERNSRRYNKVVVSRLALGSERGTAFVSAHFASTMNSISDGSQVGDIHLDRVEQVEVETVDNLLSGAQNSRLDYLKIDTEGQDLEVLRGSQESLRRQQISFVQVEAGMNIGNETHVHFAEFISFMADFGYLTFGVYDQVAEWKVRKPYLRRANIVFISREFIDEMERAGIKFRVMKSKVSIFSWCSRVWLQ